MVTLSSNEIKRLGKRLRDGSRSAVDIETLEDFRATYDPILLDTSFKIRELLAESGIKYLIAGRSKRVKSIIRKLQRPKNSGMDLSRVADLVGLRIIVADLQSQDRLSSILQSNLDIKSLRDTRDEGGPYRAIHLIARQGKKFVEIQIRNLIQHVWADESESFGEQVKEGGGSKEHQNYLHVLSDACLALDRGQTIKEESYNNILMTGRSPITGKYARISEMFSLATAENDVPSDSQSFVAIFDSATNQLLKEIAFTSSERDEALTEYKRLGRTLDDVRYDVLILNSPSNTALPVTHPRFYPGK